MKISIDDSRGFPVAHLLGGFSCEDSELFIQQMHPLVSTRGGRLAFCLEKLTSIDSSGLSCLINIVTRARLAEGQVVLVGPTEPIKGVFEVSRLDQWFDICETLDEAAALLK